MMLALPNTLKRKTRSPDLSGDPLYRVPFEYRVRGEIADLDSIDQQTAEQLLSQIDQLSEQEVDALLSQMLVAADEPS